MTGYWKPLPSPGVAVRGGCLLAPARPGRLKFNYSPHPGFGFLALRKDGEVVDSTVHIEGSLKLVREWNDRADLDPCHDWVIEVDGPMSGVRYRRRSASEWVASETSVGFA